MTTYWTNSDGLRVEFGTRTSDPVPGPQGYEGVETEVRVEIVGTDLSTAPLDRDIAHGAILPSGATLTSGNLYVTEAFDSAGDAATLTIGTYKVSDGTADDADGISGTTIAQTELDFIGDLVVMDGAQFAAAGGSTSRVLAQDDYIGVIYETAAYTAGKATLVLKYIEAGS